MKRNEKAETLKDSGSLKVVGSPRVELGTPTVSSERQRSRSAEENHRRKLPSAEIGAIPAENGPVHTIDWIGGLPHISVTQTKSFPKQCDKSVTFSTRRARA